MKTQNKQFNLIVILTVLFFFFNVVMFASGENPTKTVKTLFGTEMQIQNVTLCKYKNVAFYVAIGSPIDNLYRNDHFKFEVFMSLHLNDYKNENKIFLNS